MTYSDVDIYDDGFVFTRMKYSSEYVKLFCFEMRWVVCTYYHRVRELICVLINKFVAGIVM
jgi:hypothetical protein